MNTSESLSTGPALAVRIAAHLPALISGEMPREVAMPLRIAVMEVERLIARRSALQAATAIIDPTRTLSRWGVALALESALKRFDGLPRQRVEAGCREASPLERHLVVLMDTGGARCARKLFDEMHCNR